MPIKYTILRPIIELSARKIQRNRDAERNDIKSRYIILLELKDLFVSLIVITSMAIKTKMELLIKKIKLTMLFIKRKFII